jgi:hypothetical protein
VTDPTFGLGHPGGLIVTGGLGHAEPAPAGVMAATITGTTTITATLSADSASTTVDLLAATIVGTSALTATAAATLTADDMTLLSLNPDLFLALAA